jgi:phosphoglucosamine mutase
LEQRADLGIVITASHNPASDNGIKIFDARGAKLSTVEELEIEALIDQAGPCPDNFSDPKCFDLDISGFYINHLNSLMDPNCLKHWSVVLDTANGATCQTSPSVFAHWGAELHLLGNNSEAGLINDGVGSEYPQELARTVLATKASIGIAHDGDGDRVVICDEKGHVVDGDVLLGLLGMDAMRNGVLTSDTFVATVHSNLGLDRSIAKVGGKVERVDVGDRNVAERMREIGSNLGGESSGHIIFSDLATTGDGLIAAAKITELMCKRGMPLSELTKEVVLFPQLTKNLRVTEKLPLENLAHLEETKRRILKKFGEAGRVLIRYSGTEPKLRVLVEGTDAAILKIALDELEESARMDLDTIDS